MKNKNLIYLLSFIAVVIIIAELIGIKSVSLFNTGITITFLPLVYAVAITMFLALGPIKKLPVLRKIYSKDNIKFASTNMLFIMLPLMARYGADIAPKINEIASNGFIFIFQELGNVGTVILGMPIALLLGLKREAIGATLGLGREGELAYITEKYTLDSDEGKGILGMYIFGTLFGAIFFSVFAPLLLNIGYSVEALAMASGVGSGSMMSAASASLVAQVPSKEETILAYAGASQLLTSFLGTYTMVFIAIPVQKLIFEKITKKPYYIKGEK